MFTIRWQVFLKKVIHNNSQAESEATEDEDTSEEVELEKRLPCFWEISDVSGRLRRWQGTNRRI